MNKSSIKPKWLPVNGQNIPDELKQQSRWAPWDYVNDRKVPQSLKGKWAIASTDLSKWGAYKDAAQCVIDHQMSGIGFTLTDGDYIGIDVDGCRDPIAGTLDERGTLAVYMLHGQYCEVSPSGTGLKFLIRATPEQLAISKSLGSAVGDKGQQLEQYCTKRYFTLTGHTLDGKPGKIADCNGSVITYLTDHFTKAHAKSEQPPNPARMEANYKRVLEVMDFLGITYGPREIDDDGGYRHKMTSLCPLCEDHPDKHVCDGAQAFGVKPDGVIWAKCLHARCEWGYRDLLALTYERSDYGVARRVRDFVNGRIFYVPEWGKWVAYDGRSFVIDRAGHLVDAIVAISKQMLNEVEPPNITSEKPNEAEKELIRTYKVHLAFCNKYQSAKGIGEVERLCRGLMAGKYDTLDANPDIFPVDNVAVHLESAKPISYSPELRISKIANVTYNPKAKCPRWVQFIDEVTCGDKALADYLQRICGYCLSGRVKSESLFVLYGEGSNGKSVFVKTMLGLLGPYGGPVQQELLMSTPSQHPTQFAYLHGKRCVVAQETDQDCRLNEAQVKALTGGDRIQCRRMREDFWEFDPTHKIFLATNHLPLIRGTDHGIWRRIRLIPWLAKFDGAQQDANLTDKLTAERSGILNWCIEGYRNYLFDGLEEPTAVVNARNEYKGEMDIVQQFYEVAIEAGDGRDYITNEVLFKVFKEYCEAQGAFGGRLPSSRKLHHDIGKKPEVTVGKKDHERVKFGIKFNKAALDKYWSAENARAI